MLLKIKEGDDLQAALGISKYEPKVPTHLAGEVKNLFGNTLKYDIENIQKYPNVLEEGETVVMTEKLHGTWTCLAYIPGLNDPELLNGNMFATSKGQSEKGLVFKNNEANANNLYHKALLLYQTAVMAIAEGLEFNTPVYVLGETFGPVQDLTYGLVNPEFRVFDIYVGEPGQGRYLDYDELVAECEAVGLEYVPVAYYGPYSKEAELEVRDGKTLFSSIDQIREGVVIKPVRERQHPTLGRVQLKSVSPDYLLRKGKKGVEVTEFQ